MYVARLACSFDSVLLHCRENCRIRRPARSAPSAMRSLLFARSFCSTNSSSFAVKNVTKSNFNSALTDLRSHVHAADFVAIDLEMTGVASAPWRESFEFDRFDIRYLKIKDSAEKFAVVQFGVCPFHWDQSKDSFVAHPHNFYVFPRQELPIDVASQEFLCQTSSIEFLAKHQFDFNTCIREGVSYLSRIQEEEAMRIFKLENENKLSKSMWKTEKSEDEKSEDIPLVRLTDVFFTERMKNRIRDWRGKLLEEKNTRCKSDDCSKDVKGQFETIFYNRHPAISLCGFTCRQERLIQLVVEKHFNDLVYVRVPHELSSKHLIIYIESRDDISALMEHVKEDFLKNTYAKVNAAIGFRHVIDLLSSENKLIVGHNCLLDIAQIHSKFFGPLPMTPEEFASSVHRYFPLIIDTKLILTGNSLFEDVIKKNCTSLSKAFSLLCPQLAHGSENLGTSFEPCVRVEVQVDGMSSYTWNSGTKHEAGYDAFMTGCLFAQVCHNLGVDYRQRSHPSCLAHDGKLSKHVNLLSLSWVSGEIIDLRAATKLNTELSHSLKDQQKISYENNIFMWGFPSTLKPRKIRECITKAFGTNSVSHIFKVDESAVLVQFSKVEFVSIFISLKEALGRRCDPLSVLHPLGELFEGGNTRAAPYEIYHQICSSPVSKLLFADQVEEVGVKWTTKSIFESLAHAETFYGESLKGTNMILDCCQESTKLEATDLEISLGNNEILALHID